VNCGVCDKWIQSSGELVNCRSFNDTVVEISASAEHCNLLETGWLVKEACCSARGKIGFMRMHIKCMSSN
jgi:hypothetical protein